MNQKENYLAVLNHRPRAFPAVFFTSAYSVGFGANQGPWFEKGPLGGGADGFGVRWVTPSSGGGAPIPAPGEFLLEDVTSWREDWFGCRWLFDSATNGFVQDFSGGFCCSPGVEKIVGAETNTYGRTVYQ